MDTLHLSHVLGKSVRDIGHGVMLVCFSDKRGAFHFGLGYKCGGSLQVVCWEEDEKKVCTVPARSFPIAFTGIRKWKHFEEENFQSGDFLFKDWFDDEKKRALIRKEEMIYDIVDLLARLNIKDIGKAVEHIKRLRPVS